MGWVSWMVVIIAAWILIGFVVGVIAGKAIKFGMSDEGDDDGDV